MQRTSFIILWTGILSVFLSCSKPALTTSGKYYAMNDIEAPRIDSSIYMAAEPYRSSLHSTMSEILCYSASPLEKGQPEGRLGNFIADVCLIEGNDALKAKNTDSLSADFVILNNGSLRKPLPKGTITLGDIYEVMPFENSLILFTMNSQEVQELCDFIATMNGAPVSGIRFIIDKKDTVAKDIRISEKTLEPEKTYRVLTADYLANGGDKFPFTRLGNRKIDTGLKIRDALIKYCRSQGERKSEINIKTDGRIRYANE